MRVDPTGTIAGYPALLVRDALRRVCAHLYWSFDRLEKLAGLPTGAARSFVKALEAAGLVERAGPVT